MDQHDISLARNNVIEKFCTLEDIIGLCVYEYYRNTTIKEFIEDIFMSGVNGFGLKRDLLMKIIGYNPDIVSEFFTVKNSRINFKNNLREINTIRNYFAHTPLETNCDGLHRSANGVDFTVDLKKKYDDFKKMISEIQPIVEGIYTRILEQKSAKN